LYRTLHLKKRKENKPKHPIPQNPIIETQAVFYASTKWNLETKKSVKKTLSPLTGQALITAKSPTFPPP